MKMIKLTKKGGRVINYKPKMIATSVALVNAERDGIITFGATFCTTSDIWNVPQDKHIDLMIKALREFKKEILASPNKDYIGLDKVLPPAPQWKEELVEYMAEMGKE